MEDKVYIYEKRSGIYCGITREELANLLVYVVENLPTMEDLVYKMIMSNHMSALYGQYLLMSNPTRRVCWIDMKELGELEEDHFTKVYDMNFEYVY